MNDLNPYEEGLAIDLAKANDRIEALIAERDQAWKRAGHAEKMWGEAEVKLAEYKHVASAIDTQWAESQDEIADLKAKLAKAIKDLKCAKAYIVDACKRHDDRPNIIKNIMREMAEEDFASICTTIAELTGDKDG